MSTAPAGDPSRAGGRSARRRLLPVLLAAAALLAAASGLRAQDAGGQTGQSGTATVPADRETVARLADRARVRGDTSAPVRILEVSDFECPYCRQYFRETYPVIDSLYVHRGLVEYVWLAFPNPNHHRSWPAIEAAFCAGAAGRFWPMHDTLFTNQGEWSNAADPLETFVGYARSLGIDEASFRACLVQDRASSLIARDYGQAARGGVNGTPFFVIADSLSFQGVQPASKFRSVLDGVLRARGVEPPR